MPQPDSRRNRDATTHNLAALAEEDRAALSGRPRKANAGQYAGVMQQRPPARNRDATAQPGLLANPPLALRRPITPSGHVAQRIHLQQLNAPINRPNDHLVTMPRAH